MLTFRGRSSRRLTSVWALVEISSMTVMGGGLTFSRDFDQPQEDEAVRADGILQDRERRRLRGTAIDSQGCT